MADHAKKCPHCGARAKDSGPHCAFCGSRLPAFEAQIAAEGSASPSTEQRFERLERHASYAELLNRRPSASGPIAQGVFGIFVTGAILLVAISVASGFGLFSWAAMQVTAFGALFSVLPILVVGVAVFMFARMIWKTTQLSTAEFIVQPSLIADERTDVSGGGDGPKHTRYYVTLEARDGLRSELVASGRLAGRVTRGDIGVAYIKADHLIEFERVQV